MEHVEYTMTPFYEELVKSPPPDPWSTYKQSIAVTINSFYK